jgi:hypothetical protein
MDTVGEETDEYTPGADIYSKRGKKLPDVYQYDAIPERLRVQIVHIWESAFGKDGYSGQVEYNFKGIEEILCREYGVFSLDDKNGNKKQAVVQFLLRTVDIDRFLDVIELSFRMIDWVVRRNLHLYHNTQKPDEAIEELNYRFREHGVGYQYQSGNIIRVDSQIIHTEVVRPALGLLSHSDYRGANEEFLSAHEHYRKRKYKECLNDCLKAFESTMKSICTKRQWALSSKATAKELLGILFANELIPKFMQSHMAGLRTTLESGVPTVRNKLGGHGQGTTPVEVPDYVAAYALHLTATNIVLLIQAEESR